MSPKKINKKKKPGFESIKSLVPKKLDLPSININPIGTIEDTKNKISNFYDNYKKDSSSS